MTTKKGNAAVYVSVVIGLVLAILLLVNIAFPQWRTVTDSQAYNEQLDAHVLGGGDTTTTLTYTDLEPGSVSVTGLAVTNNYTVDYDAGTITILNKTLNGTYTAYYYYYSAGYIDNIGTRAMAGVLILLIIVGLVGGTAKMFGLI